MPRYAPVLGAVAVIALAGLVIFELTNWDKITPGVTALGTPVGGLSRTEAMARLAPGVQQLLDRPLDIHGGDKAWRSTPRELGLRLDPAELAGAAYEIGRQGNPKDRLGEQVDVFVHGKTVSSASSTDQAALDTSLSAMALQIVRPARDAQLSLANNATFDSVTAENGLAVDVGASREQIAHALNSGSQNVELVTRPVPPAIPDEQVSTAREQLEHLLGPSAQPLQLTFGQQSWRMERADLLKLITLSGGTRPGQPATVNIDEAPLRAWAARIGKETDQTVQDARFRFANGALQVTRPSRQGRKLDQEATVQAVRVALLRGEPTVPLPMAVTEPSVSSENPQALGITELIDRGSTSFAGSIPEKKFNIRLAAERISGVVVAPGGTFSFNQAVGPTTLDAGFKWGFGITSGNDGPKTVPSVAGGICQVATTLFQPVFWSGFQLEERYWHLYWIPAYTSRGVVGLDVTVDPDAGLDFKWTNTTGSYILVQADSDDEKVYFGLYGKKPSWKVQVDDAVVSNRMPPDPKPIVQEEPSMQWGRTLAVETARDGFDVEVTRRVIPNDGATPRTLNLKSTYQPAHTVTLVGSAGKPPGVSIDEAIQKVLDAQKAALEAKATPSPGATVAPGGTPAAGLTAAPTPAGQSTAVPKPGAATPAPAATAGVPQPTPKPQAPQPTPKPGSNPGIAPTAPPR
jgi:vancomycin resistance protein YoaR